MNKPPDQLSLLRAKYFETIRIKQSEVAALQQKIALLDELEKDAASLMNGSSTTGRFAKMSLIEATYETIKEIGINNSAVPISAVRQHLLDHGYVSKGNNFSISVAVALKRLAKRPLTGVGSKMSDGKRYFWFDGESFGIGVKFRANAKNGSSS